jgi:hypothetical protein
LCRYAEAVEYKSRFVNLEVKRKEEVARLEVNLQEARRALVWLSLPGVSDWLHYMDHTAKNNVLRVM